MKTTKKIAASVVSLALSALFALPVGMKAVAEKAVAVPATNTVATTDSTETAETAVDRSFAFDETMEGKAFVFYGDSITERCGLYADVKDYTQLLQEEYGFYAFNAAVSGATATTASGATNHLVAQLEKTKTIYRDADYVSFFIGTNDFGSARPLGSIDSMDTGTYYGAIQTAIERIVAVNPDVKIMLLTPLWRGDGKITGFDYYNKEAKDGGYTLEDVRQAVKAIGEKYACKVVDQTALFNAENCTWYMNPDRLHVYQNGYKAIVENIKAN